MSNCIKEYLKDCQTLLPMYGEDEKKFIQRLNDNLIEFEEEKKDISYEDIVKRFGNPTSIVYAYVEELDTDVLIKNIRRTKIIKKAVIIVIAIVLSCSLIATIYQLYNLNKLYEEVKRDQPTQVETIIE